MKNEDKVRQKFILKRGQSRTEEFEKKGQSRTEKFESMIYMLLERNAFDSIEFFSQCTSGTTQ